MDINAKKPADSYTEAVHIVTSADMNGCSRLFGGMLMEWIDICAAVAARRHAGRNVTTVKVHGLEFREPAFANDLVVLESRVVWVGRTSMDVRCDCYIERLDGSRLKINKAYLTMVALDENDVPTPVPPLELTSAEERAEWELAEIRRKK